MSVLLSRHTRRRELIGLFGISAAGWPWIAASQPRRERTARIGYLAPAPIVGLGEDFVGAGFAKSMARPRGNVTGVSILATELDAKRLEVLRAALPAAKRVGPIADPGNPLSPERWRLIEKAARDLEVSLAV